MKKIALTLALIGSAMLFSEGKPTAADILEQTDVKGGVMVVLGCDDPAWSADLHNNGSFTVVCLDTDRERITRARAYFSEHGVHGPVTAMQWDGENLPFGDHLVNLIVSGVECRVSKEEIQRALTPEGFWLSLDTRHQIHDTFTKHVPDALDDWPQYFYSATGNAVSRDTVVGPPRTLQWWAGPYSDRSHNWVNSSAAMVSAGGRLFYIRDEGPITVQGQAVNDMNWSTRKGNKFDLPENWALIARDAFNGKRLWKRPLENFGQFSFEAIGQQPTSWNCWSAPLSLNRRVAAASDTVYATLAYRGGLTALDSRTGETRWAYRPEGAVDEVVLDAEAGRVYLRVRSEIPKKLDNPFSWERIELSWKRTYGPVEYEQYVLEQPPEKIVCLDTSTGEEQWSYDTPHVAVESLCAGFGKVCFFDYRELVCLDAESGEKVWGQAFTLPKATRAKKVDGKKQRGNWAFRRSGQVGQLMLWDHKAFFFSAPGPHGSSCFNLEDGEVIWSNKRAGPRGGFGHPTGVRIIGDTIWNDYPMAFDVASGELIEELKRPLGPTHSRCHRGVATEKYVMGIAFGIEFYDLQAKQLVSDDRWLRSACALGYLPANGLLYHTPDPCRCWMGARIRGFHAFGPKEPDVNYDRVDETERLEKGEAYGEGSGFKVQGSEKSDLNTEHQTPDPSSDWPQYRHDARRSGQASCAVPADAKILWQTDLKSPYTFNGQNLVAGLTPPTIADGRVYVSRKNAHEVTCLDSKSGQVLWRHLTPAPVDSPPTIVGSGLRPPSSALCIFGCMDGYVYGLRADDGTLVWRFRAAPTERMAVFDGRIGSKWPVNGSVLIKDGAVYCAAGVSSFLDGGIQFYKLDPATGKLLAHARATGPHYDLFKTNPFYEARTNKWGRRNVFPDGFDPRHGDIEGARTDILVSDGVDIRMGQTRITPDLKISSILREEAAGTAPKRHWLRPLHLFLDDSYFHRSGWHYSARYNSRAPANSAKAGKLLVFDDQHCYSAEWERAGKSATYPNHIIGEGTQLNCDSLETTNAEKLNAEGIYREAPPVWRTDTPLIVRAMLLAQGKDTDGKTLFAAGPIERAVDDPDPLAPHYGKTSGRLQAFSAADGKPLTELELSATPIFDGMAAADGKLFISLADGTLVCLGKPGP